LQVEAWAAFDNLDRSGARGQGTRCDVAGAHVPRRQHVIVVEALELGLEKSNVQPGRVGLAAPSETGRIAVEREIAADEAEHATAAPHPDVDVVRDSIPQPMPTVGEIESATGEVGAKRRGRVNRQAK
jgi:hypothetical protein